MKSRVLLTAFFMSLAAVQPAASYETLVEDYGICMGGGGKVANAKIVQACSRLIDKSAKKNGELIGGFHLMRALANTDKAANCRDARKARQMLKDPKLAVHVNTVEKNNCGRNAAAAGRGCMSDRSSSETASGKLVIKNAQDAAGRPEKAYIIELQSPACLSATDKEDNVKSARTVHIFGDNGAVHTRIASFVGRNVVVHGRPFPALTVHHHAPIVMEITKIGGR